VVHDQVAMRIFEIIDLSVPLDDDTQVFPGDPRMELAGHPGLGFSTHHMVAEAGGVICENLTNLEAIGDDQARISLLPIALARADGAPVRAVAVRFAM